VFVKVTLFENEFPVELFAKKIVPLLVSFTSTRLLQVSPDEFAKVQLPVLESMSVTVEENVEPPLPVLELEPFFTAVTEEEKVVPENLIILAVTFSVAEMVPLVKVDVLPVVDSLMVSVPFETYAPLLKVLL